MRCIRYQLIIAKRRIYQKPSLFLSTNLSSNTSEEFAEKIINQIHPSEVSNFIKGIKNLNDFPSKASFERILSKISPGNIIFAKWLSSLGKGRVRTFPVIRFNDEYGAVHRSITNTLSSILETQSAFIVNDHKDLGAGYSSVSELASYIMLTMPVENASVVSSDLEKFAKEMYSPEQFCVQLKKSCGKHTHSVLPLLKFLGIEYNNSWINGLREKTAKHKDNVSALAAELRRLLEQSHALVRILKDHEPASSDSTEQSHSTAAATGPGPTLKHRRPLAQPPSYTHCHSIVVRCRYDLGESLISSYGTIAHSGQTIFIQELETTVTERDLRLSFEKCGGVDQVLLFPLGIAEGIEHVDDGSRPSAQHAKELLALLKHNVSALETVTSPHPLSPAPLALLAKASSPPPESPSISKTKTRKNNKRIAQVREG